MSIMFQLSATSNPTKSVYQSHCLRKRTIRRTKAGADDDEDDDDGYEEEEEEQSGDEEGNYTEWVSHSCLDTSRPPLSDVHGIFDAIAQVAIENGFLEACLPFEERGIRVFTLCSGSRLSLNVITTLQSFFRDVTEFPAHAENPNDKVYFPFTAYGRQAKPTRGAHILIAGSSCIDFSFLNKDRKKLEQDGVRGESLDTMDGVLAYAKQYRPNLILLENVIKAPWAKIKDEWSKADYSSTTRNRAYCLLIDRKHAEEIDFNVEAASEEWASLMARFQRRASSPYSDFILHEDDERLHLAKRVYDGSKGRPWAGDWAACRKRHTAIRLEQHLGTLNTYTKREGNSRPRMDDSAWQSWAVGLPIRVLDDLDTNFNRHVCQRDFDMRYKHRNIDISQNVDRDLDARQWGVVGCITPKGSLFETLRGGPIELQDLAGNAMTATVVGAAIFSAIIACHHAASENKTDPSQQISMFQKYTNQYSHRAARTPAPSTPLLNERGLIKKVGFHPLRSSHEVFSYECATSLKYIMPAAIAAQPLCRREGLGQHTTRQRKQCPECFYTCCDRCSRQDHHGLEKLLPAPTADRSSPKDFIQQLSQTLPPLLALKNIPTHQINRLDDSASKVLALMQKALDRTVAPQAVRGKDAVRPFEDAKQAAEYEDALKHRPKPAMATMHYHEKIAFLDVQINIKIMVHRAVAELPSFHYHRPTLQPSFGPLKLLSNSSETLMEQSPPIWEEMALVESRLSSLGWRLEARALAPTQVRGGAIAGEVGAGKPTTSLALVNMDYTERRSGCSFDSNYSLKHVQSDATLILVPKNIITQWETELKACLDWTKLDTGSRDPAHPHYILVDSTKSLERCSFSDIISATLILAPWDLFEDTEYWKKLRNVTCGPNIPAGPGRAFYEWLNEEMRLLRDGVEQLQSHESKFWVFWEELRCERKDYDRFMAFLNRANSKAERAKKDKSGKEGRTKDETGDEENHENAMDVDPSGEIQNHKQKQEDNTKKAVVVRSRRKR
ncbi:uncharacterized protein Z518_03779 [Rhinocladiella mackenziei CBS 650.93]|uniref:Rhinocladiella mackenziei CBS 650.93 unplaced genomic scaffold supercont1.3, whole genome shotgun sequence n=1 Tax=Rhinocladiella mackenziei CBS 650.93 TaxID=1442369 RepID=A0A0D2FUN7_9EURO|nr:uncharacterized protein Z518_03779 [Rhinocladiella mackenziei CBS 650.93]KIX05807.1 hypothetical protein Z518_03779 [Rhinocladiella mackenziei CBS 650.93]